MRKTWLLGVVMAGIAMGSAADTNSDRGTASGKSVLQAWGSDDSFKAKALTPMANNQQMTTIDGSKSFNAQASCPGAKQFLVLTAVPDNTGDIASLTVDMDTNLDGTSDQRASLAGPFTAMCDNGIIKCDAGTMNNCSYFGWQVSQSGVALNPNNSSGQPNTMRDLGACYCFNNSCGSSLLLQNAQKILDDAGAGIAVAMSATVPRFAMSSSKMVDTTSAEFYGQSSGCGTDQQPEQYYNNTGALEAKGQQNRSDQNSDYNKVLASQTATGHGSTTQQCQVNRTIAMTTYWNDSAVSPSFSGDGSVASCGSGCIQVTVGKSGDNYLQASCGLYSSTANITVNRPELVTSVTLIQAHYDDWLRLKVNGNIVYNVDPNWTGSGPRCGENGNRGTSTPNTNLTSWFKNVTAGSVVQVMQETSYADKGEGWAILQINYAQDCKLSNETVDDQCTAQENNSQCDLRDEQVDGVQTYMGFSRTGLTPMPTTKTISSGSCSQQYTRDFFNKTRTYTCPTSALPYSGDAAQKRFQSVHGSFDPSTGNYTDTTTPDGGQTYTTTQVTMPLPPKQTEPACVMVCQTRKPRPGVSVTDSGPANKLNPNGVAYDFTWRECTETNACPAQAGEDVVTACGCRNNFGQAAAAMQTIRQMAEDSVCQKQ